MARPRSLFPGRKPSTLGGWLRLADRLYARCEAAMGQISPNSHDEALYLILRTLGLPLDSEASILSDPVTAAESGALEAVFRRRLEDKVPAAYLTKEALLGGCSFYVDERVLIPRSYFVEIIEHQLDGWLPPASGLRKVADLCTGSGCLAILLARHFPKAAVDAVDLSEDALDVARINVRRHRLGGRVRLWRSDVFDSVPKERYDIILSNPPYEPTAHVDGLPEEFRREPRLALDGGADGLRIIRKILVQSARRLKPHGILMIEVGGLRAAMDSEFPGLDLHWLATEDGSDCVCVINARRLAAVQAEARS